MGLRRACLVEGLEDTVGGSLAALLGRRGSLGVFFPSGLHVLLLEDFPEMWTFCTCLFVCYVGYCFPAMPHLQ